jgi:hypothetical protein
VQRLDDALDARVVGRHAVPDEPERRGWRSYRSIETSVPDFISTSAA